MKSKKKTEVDYAVTLILVIDQHSTFNVNFIFTGQMNLSRTYRIYNFLTEMYYSNIINGKSREDLHRGQRGRGFRVGHCHVRNTKSEKAKIYIR